MNVDKLKNGLDDFLSNEDDENFDNMVENQKKLIIKNCNSIIERVDKIYITEDGRQLLREQY